MISDLIQYIGDKADKPNYTPDTSQNKVSLQSIAMYDILEANHGFLVG